MLWALAAGGAKVCLGGVVKMPKLPKIRLSSAALVLCNYTKNLVSVRHEVFGAEHFKTLYKFSFKVFAMQ